VAPVRTIKINHRDLDSADAAREELERQIRSAERDPSQVDNPISSAINLTRLRESGIPQEAQLAQIVEAIAQLGHEFASFRAEITRQLAAPLGSVPVQITGGQIRLAPQVAPAAQKVNIARRGAVPVPDSAAPGSEEPQK
jgi:hypothetical protein